MKKCLRFLAVLLAVTVLSGLFAACSDQSQTDAQTPSASEARALGDVYADIIALGILPEMYMLEDAYVEGYYGIAPEAVSEKVFAVADDSLLADTVIILKVAGEGSASDIAEGFREINRQRLAEMESYNPVQFQRAEDAQIGTLGEYAYYIITDDNAAVMNIIENSIG